MARVSRFINIAEEGKFDVSKTTIAAALSEGRGSLDEAIKVSVNRICGRFKNDYIIDPAKTRVLISSIEKEGLLQPIVILNIKDYLASNKVQNDEKEYYEEKMKEGFDFFIVAGHRRFRAFASLLSEELIETNDDLERFYKNVKDLNSKVGSKFKVKFGKSESEPWTEILSIIANPEDLDEILAYLHSNITARAPSQFEVVTSVYNQLVRTGVLDESLEKYRKSTRDTVTALLVRYIKDVYAIDIPKSRISNYLRVNQNINEEIKNCIFDGRVSLKEVEKILPIYQNILDDGLVNQLIEDVKKGNFKASSWVNKYKIESEEKPTKKEVLSMLYQVKEGTLSIDEVIEILSK